jgi:hypothetical protein
LRNHTSLALWLISEELGGITISAVPHSCVDNKLENFSIRIIAIQTIEGETFIGHHSVERSTTIQPQMALGVLTTKEHLDAFVQGMLRMPSPSCRVLPPRCSATMAMP